MTERAVEAYLTDWPADDEERRIQLATLREAIMQITLQAQDKPDPPHLRPV